MERKFKITVDGRPYTVTVEEISEGHTPSILPEPGSMHIPVPSPVTTPSAATATTQGAPGDEISPLAGVVQAVLVTVGQAVKEGDKLVAIEAMKMISHIVAHRSGTVTRILVKPGDSVDAGQPIVNID